MKKIFCLFILTLGFISCSSDDENAIDNSELIGKWNWVSSCGGFTGGCWYPSEDNYESVEFMNDLYIKKNNGIVDTEINYSITDSHINGTDVLYIIELQNGNILRFRFIDSNLSIAGGDFWKEYERTTE
jgi:hypothetical protein